MRTQIEELEKARASDVILAVGQLLEKEDGCDEAVSCVQCYLLSERLLHPFFSHKFSRFPSQDIALLMRQLSLSREVPPPSLIIAQTPSLSSRAFSAFGGRSPVFLL